MGEKEDRFRIIIVGGSVAGLTLAHCLWRNKIDFIILEANGEIAPQAGASIGILPNGARILDQLGLFDDVLDAVEPLRHSSFWAGSGSHIMSSDAPKIMAERHGYPINFLDRRTLLEILSSNLNGCHGKLFLTKRVTQMEHFKTHVVAHCQDGSTYQGDLIVGADGIRSVVRQQMWNYMISQGLSKEVESEGTGQYPITLAARNTQFAAEFSLSPLQITVTKFPKAMTSEYDCVFGISPETTGLIPGHTHRTFGKDYSFLTISSKNGRVYWFFFTKLDRRYGSHEIPRFEKQDIDKHVAPFLHKPLSGTVSFKKVYERALVKTHLALEEASYKHWHKGRFVCIGDSIHKMTPNAGQGGNSAIESAATLSNHLSNLLQQKSCPEAEDINNCLQSWQKSHRPRATKISNSANELTRLEAGATFKDSILGLYLLPYLQSFLIDKFSAQIVGAARLDCVGLPERSLHATMPYKDETKAIHQSDLSKRSLLCIPLLGCFGAARAVMAPLISKVRPFMVPFFVGGSWTSGTGETVDLRGPIYRIPFMDKLFKPLIFCFLPSITGTDPVSCIQMRSFITDLGPVFGIWMLESYRNCHSPSVSLLPLLAGTAFQLKGIGIWAPIYYTLEYLHAPLGSLLSGGHEIAAQHTISLLLALLGGLYLPIYLNFTSATVESRRFWNAVWQPFPVIVPTIARVIRLLSNPVSKAQNSADSAKSRMNPSKINMFWIRAAYIGFAAISGFTWIHSICSAPANSSLLSIFWPGLDGHLRPVASFMDGIARFLQYDQIFAMGSGFVWLALRLHELGQSGATFSWLKVAGSFIGATAALGPGAAFSLGWGWKEEFIHKMASL